MKRYSDSLDSLTSFLQWLAVFPQLVSRIVHKNDLVWKALIEIICSTLR